MKKIIQTELEGDSFFTSEYLKLFLRSNSPIPASAAEKSRGMRFIVLADFHDAKITSISLDSVWGKDCVDITVNFGQTSTSFKKGNKFRIRFLGVRNMTLPEKTRDLFVIDSDCFNTPDGLQANFELVYYIGQEGRRDVLQIGFTDIDVKPLKKF